MRVQKVQDDPKVLNNVNKGDIFIYSKHEYIEQASLEIENIYWVEYSDNRGISMKSFSDGGKFVVYEELKNYDYWFFLKLTFYLSK